MRVNCCVSKLVREHVKFSIYDIVCVLTLYVYCR